MYFLLTIGTEFCILFHTLFLAMYMDAIKHDLMYILLFVKPAVSSRVIATPREIPSRQEVIKRERTDERSRQRNKRMFGALLSTLQKFRQEETKLKAKVKLVFKHI